MYPLVRRENRPTRRRGFAQQVVCCEPGVEKGTPGVGIDLDERLRAPHAVMPPRSGPAGRARELPVDEAEDLGVQVSLRRLRVPDVVVVVADSSCIVFASITGTSGLRGAMPLVSMSCAPFGWAQGGQFSRRQGVSFTGGLQSRGPAGPLMLALRGRNTGTTPWMARTFQ